LSFKLLWPELPFIDRVGLVFLLCALIAVIVSLAKPQPLSSSAVNLEDVDFSTSTTFNLASIAVVLVLSGFYIAWW
jgi:SSS family solute:Na+ symporter